MALRIDTGGPRPDSIGAMLALSLAAHLGGALMLLLAPYLLPRRAPASPILVAELVSLPSGGAGPLEAPRATPPEPAARKKETPPSPPAEKQKPKAKKTEAVKLPEPGKTPPPKAASKAEPQPEPEPAPAAAAGVTPPGASPEPGPAPGVGGAGAPGFGEQTSGGIGALDAETFEFAWYRAAITQKLRTAWAKPAMQDLAATVRTVVYFKVMRNGRIVEIHLESPSGLDALDRSALRAVYDANPLPPLPYAYKEEILGVHFFFELVPEP